METPAPTPLIDHLTNAPTKILSVDVPIHAHHLRDDLPDTPTITQIGVCLTNSQLTTAINFYLNISSPLYNLYLAYLQSARLSMFTARPASLAEEVIRTAIIKSIHQELKDSLLSVLYQLEMSEFLDNLKCYLDQLHSPSPATPSISSSPLTTAEEAHLIQIEAHWSGHKGRAILFPDHPCFHDTCHKCHCLGHFKVNCQFYQCCICLVWELLQVS